MTKWRKPSADRILEAAEKVFARRGYGGTSLRQLMSAAGVSTTAFYARFASKEDVLRALALRLLEELEGTARTELAQSIGLEDSFRRGVDVLFDVLAPRRALVRILLTEAASSAEITQTIGRLHTALAALLAGRIEALVARGSVHPLDATSAAWSFVGALNMQIQRWAVYEHVSTEALQGTLHAVASSLLPVLRPVSGVRRKRPRPVANQRRSKR